MNRRAWQHYDLVLLASLVLLLIYGVAVIFSASHAIERVKDSAVRQAIFAAIGLTTGLVLTAIDYRLLDAFTVPLYVLVVGLLIAVFVIGQVTFNAQRSIDLGIINLQPSELSKPLLIIVLAAFLAKREEGGSHLVTLGLSALLIGVPVVLIYREPDLGTALVLTFIWLAMIFASGIPLIYLGAVLGSGLVAVPFLWLSMQDYMRRRVVTFINPASDPQSYYNIQQALYAIGSGGWFGKGYLKGTQSQLHFLLVQHTDFVFAVLCEELGLAGALFLFVLLIVVLLRTLHAARLARDTFGRLLCTGVAAWVFVQCVVNIGMNMSLLPVTGLPLPFISYGGSSLVTLLTAMGLVQSVRMRHRKIEF